MSDNHEPSPRIETLGQGRYLQLVREGRWEYAHRVRGTGVVAVIAVTENDELILTEQYRMPVKRRVIDLPAGLVGDDAGQEDEAFTAAALRELSEETGYEADGLTWLCAGPTSAGMVTEVIHFYLASGVKQTGAGGGDGTEDIQVHLVPRAQACQWLLERGSQHVLIDPKAFMALPILDQRDSDEHSG